MQTHNIFTTDFMVQKYALEAIIVGISLARGSVRALSKGY